MPAPRSSRLQLPREPHLHQPHDHSILAVRPLRFVSPCRPGVFSDSMPAMGGTDRDRRSTGNAVAGGLRTGFNVAGAGAGWALLAPIYMRIGLRLLDKVLLGDLRQDRDDFAHNRAVENRARAFVDAGYDLNKISSDQYMWIHARRGPQDRVPVFETRNATPTQLEFYERKVQLRAASYDLSRLTPEESTWLHGYKDANGHWPRKPLGLPKVTSELIIAYGDFGHNAQSRQIS